MWLDPPKRASATQALGSRADPRWLVAAAFALAGIYVATRLWFTARFPYFSDEGQLATYTQQAAHSINQLFISESGSPELPLFTWLGIPWIKLGFNPLIAVRLVSVVSGLLTLWVVGLLGRELGGPLVGLVSAALCVLLPFFVVHDGIGIYEPLVTLEMAAALYAQLQLARRPGLRRAAALAVVLAAGTLTKQSTEVAVILIPISLLCFDWSPEGRGGRLARWLAGVAAAAVAVFASELLLRSSHYWSQGQILSKLGIYPARSLGQTLTDPFNAVPRHAVSVFGPALVGYVTVPLIALSLIGAVLSMRDCPRLTGVLLMWVAIPAGVAVMFIIGPYPRHVMYVLPPAVVLMAYAAVRAVQWLSSARSGRSRVAIGTIAAALILAPSAVFDVRVLANSSSFHYPSSDYFQYVTGQPAGGRWPAVAETIRRRAAPGPVIIVMPRAERYVLALLLSSDARYRIVPGSSPLADRAQFAVYETGNPFLDVAANAIVVRDHFVTVGRYQRPDRGAVITLRQRPPA